MIYYKCMTRYIALLRGINVGGNNKVSMSDLRDCFGSIGLKEVTTYINSGNVLFSSKDQNIVWLADECQRAIEKRFGFPVVVMVIPVRDLKAAIANAPIDWIDADSAKYRTDALFIIPPTTAEQVLAEIQKKATSVDKFFVYGQVIFWTLLKTQYNKSVVPKIIGTPIYKSVTIRGSNTVKKLLSLSKSE
ncbi:MAG: hypothetical protein JWO07_340 [Candidatus Saccharibacteria bacterium]|nr:hypothetical protein [Candidatus Saccharibacteria bacterium]